MPHWPKEDKCFEDEQVEVIDRKGKKSTRPFLHDRSQRQINYEELLKVIVNPETNEYNPARNKEGGAIKGTGAKHIVTQIMRIRTKKDRSEYLITQGAISGFDAFGNVVRRNCASPEMWTRTIFDHQRIYNEKTNSTKMQTVGTLAQETVYEMPFNEKNLKEVFELRENDSIQFSVKDEGHGPGGHPVEVKKEPNINDTFKLFLKPFDLPP